jgi:hypothetical protein
MILRTKHIRQKLSFYCLRAAGFPVGHLDYIGAYVDMCSHFPTVDVDYIKLPKSKKSDYFLKSYIFLLTLCKGEISFPGVLCIGKLTSQITLFSFI